MRFAAGPARWFHAPAPMLGQHNDEILRGLLGLGDAEKTALRADGIIGDRPSGL
jgi:crotonobetainyl-CoA:carnitine CoA-transferase CaiB-like acyl-CoA transferase